VLLLLVLAIGGNCSSTHDYIVTSAGSSVGWHVAPLSGRPSLSGVNPTINATIGQNITFVVNAGAAERFSIHTQPNSIGVTQRYDSPYVTGSNPANSNATLTLFLVRRFGRTAFLVLVV
jgi:hypothetical protein